MSYCVVSQTHNTRMVACLLVWICKKSELIEHGGCDINDNSSSKQPINSKQFAIRRSSLSQDTPQHTKDGAEYTQPHKVVFDQIFARLESMVL